MSGVPGRGHEPERADAEYLRHLLVTSMVASGAIRSPQVQQAFATIPREAFVPSFYERNTASRTMDWLRIDSAQMAVGDFLSYIYRDEPLVTQLDERGWPCSSSSMPSIMARMLEAGEVQPGQRILEIGTGTGYHAALLSQLTGDPRLVTTIERDAMLAESAVERLKMVVGPGITVHVGDGITGFPAHAPYHRIIATASAPFLPQPWIDQLVPCGKLVMDLQGPLASGFLVIEKHATSGGASGHFLAQPLYFMPVVTEEGFSHSRLMPYQHLFHQACHQEFVLEQGNVFPDVLNEQAFRWWLQWRILGCQIREQNQTHRKTGIQRKEKVVIDSTHQTVLRFWQQSGDGDHWSGSVYGERLLWDDVQQAYEEWVHLGQPEQSAYRLELDGQGDPVLIIGSFRLPLR